MRRALPLLVLLLASGAAGWWWWGAGADAATAPRYRSAAVDRGAITAVVAATGLVNPALSVQVGSQLSGQIRELFADFNTRVAANQAIARLDTATIEARRAAAEADHAAAEAAVLVARAQAERAEADQASARAQRDAAHAAADAAAAVLRDAEGEAQRSETLRARGVGATREAERAAFNADRTRAALAQARALAAEADAKTLAAAAAARTAEAQVTAARAAAEQRAAQLRQVEVDLRNATIRSPIDGIVVSRNVDLGQTVAASFQAPVLFQIAGSLDEMEVHVTVDEADIGRIQAGQDVQFTVAAFPAEQRRGRVKEVRLAPTTVSNVVTYTVIVATHNEGGRLLPGMTATLRIITDQRSDVLRVPAAALRWRPAGTADAPAASPIEQALEQLSDLTPQQRAEIAAAQAEFRERMAAAPEAADARRQVAQTARQRLMSRLNAVLTPDQRAQLAERRSARGQSGTLWVAEEGVPRAVRVRTGLSDGSLIEIVSGDLAEGAEVIVGTERRSEPAQPARRLF